MGIVLELYELKNLCKDMAELGAANYAKMVFPAKDLISQREAYKSFGYASNLYTLQGMEQRNAPKYYTPELNY